MDKKEVLQNTGLLGLAGIALSQGTVMLYNSGQEWVGLVLYGIAIAAIVIRELLKIK